MDRYAHLALVSIVSLMIFTLTIDGARVSMLLTLKESLQLHNHSKGFFTNTILRLTSTYSGHVIMFSFVFLEVPNSFNVLFSNSPLTTGEHSVISVMR